MGNVAPATDQAAGPERVGTPSATRRQPADDVPSAPVLAAWPEPGPRAIFSTPPHHEPSGDKVAFAQDPEDDQDPTPPERRSQQIHPPDHQAIANEEPDEHLDADEDWEIIDWIGAP